MADLPETMSQLYNIFGRGGEIIIKIVSRSKTGAVGQHMKTNNIQQQMQRSFRWIVLLLSVVLLGLSAVPVHASETDGTIVTGGTAGYAWSNQIGWINFGLATTGVAIHVSDTSITGYAWSSNYGWINMAPSNGGITVAANGALTGYAWGGSLGWINFNGVTINSSGKFTGQATGTIVGILTFDCTNCNVRTDYRAANFRTSTGSSGSTSGGSSGSTGGGSIAVTPAMVPFTAPTTVPTTAPPEGTRAFPPVEAAVTGDAVGDGGEDELLPEELFDIRLLIDRANVTSFAELVARVTFESFGRVPTPVDLTFTVLNEAGEVVYTDKDEVTIETTGVFVKRFTDEEPLASGSYTIRLHTLYNDDVEDDFEAIFVVGTVGGVCTSFLSVCLVWWISSSVLFAIILFCYIFWKRHKKEVPTQKGIGGQFYSPVR